jgi:hypothetical protein
LLIPWVDGDIDLTLRFFPGGYPMRFKVLLAPVATLALVLAAAAPALAASNFPKPTSYDVELAPVGDSGVTGIAHLVLRGERLTVLIRAFGLDPIKTHPVIIHGFPGGRAALCPDAAPAVEETSRRFAADDARAVFGYGLIGLDPSPRADLSGVVSFEHGYDVTTDLVAPLERRTFVIYHESGVPLACGEIRSDPNG